jgi:hypothetical protein
MEPAAKTSRKKAAMTTAGTPAPVASPSQPAKNPFADMFKSKSSPSPGTAAATAPAPGGGPGMVWVNTDTHVYHKQGSRYYGTTKKGKYMTEADAIKEGDKAAKREVGEKKQ